MDKKKVKELMEQIDFIIHDFIDGDKQDELQNLVSEVQEELNKSDWVSVEDGLPDLDELVVACNKNRPDNWWETFRDSQMADMWKDKYGFAESEHVTHWKPIEKLEE